MCRNFDKSYLRIAREIGSRSYARRHKVGCIIVKDGQIISDGFNGTPAGFDNNCEDTVGCKLEFENWHDKISCCKILTDESGYKYKHIKPCCEWCNCENAILKTKPEVLHAEANAITKLAKSHSSGDNATLYVTLSPCFDCAKLIKQSNIKKVIFQELYRSSDGIEFLKKAGIEVEQIENIDE